MFALLLLKYTDVVQVVNGQHSPVCARSFQACAQYVYKVQQRDVSRALAGRRSWPMLMHVTHSTMWRIMPLEEWFCTTVVLHREHPKKPMDVYEVVF